jgi:hypothetical protein
VEQRLRPVTARNLFIGALFAAGLVYAAIASLTRPFTPGADVVTALPLAAAVSVLVVRTRSHRRAAAVSRAHHQTGDVPRLNRWALVWMALTAAVVSWELYCYTSAPRAAHPTLSSLIDMLDASRTGKTAAFAIWLLVGCYLVLR